MESSRVDDVLQHQRHTDVGEFGGDQKHQRNRPRAILYSHR